MSTLNRLEIVYESTRSGEEQVILCGPDQQWLTFDSRGVMLHNWHQPELTRLVEPAELGALLVSWNAARAEQPEAMMATDAFQVFARSDGYHAFAGNHELPDSHPTIAAAKAAQKRHFIGPHLQVFDEINEDGLSEYFWLDAGSNVIGPFVTPTEARAALDAALASEPVAV